MYLIFDTETTGLPTDWNAPFTDSEVWPRLVQLAWQLHGADGSLLSQGNHIIKPNGFDIPFTAAKIHGITNERAERDGIPLSEALEAFQQDLEKTTYIIGHNLEFDVNIVGGEYHREGKDYQTLVRASRLDTKEEGTEFCQIPGGRGGKFKWPTLTELHQKLFGEPFGDAHDAAYDVDATARCFFGLMDHRVIQPKESEGMKVRYQAPELKDANFAEQVENQIAESLNLDSVEVSEELEEIDFSHLHVHSQFSILQSMSNIPELVSKAKNMGSKAIALTDTGNMMGAFHFVREALKQDIVPIIGAELNVCRDHADKSVKDDGFPTVILAKNKNGYHNLAKLSSLAYTDGFYYVPRIDKVLFEQYKEDLIVLSGGLFGEIPYLILNVGEKQAEEACRFWKDTLGADFYLEINRHGLEEEAVVNNVLLRFAKEMGIKIVAANNTFYSEKKDAEAHDVLLCVKDARNVSQPKKYMGKKGREFRFGLPNDEFYIKTPEEMKALFADLPEAIANVAEIVDQIETFKLERDVLLPSFEIPEQFQDAKDLEDGGKRGENNFLRHLTYEGAKKRYPEITDDIRERLDFELETIAKTGYPGYFLIVQDFCHKAREMGVSVGPGRGSAAGSAVAYCTYITNIDPIKYDLLFERFLNPERISMPDIDIDFDDEGRQRVIDYVIDKYGANQVAQIITYGTMAAKSSLRDAGRVMELPLSDTDRIAKLVPNISLKKAFGLTPEELKKKLPNNDDRVQIEQLLEIARGHDLEAEVVNRARSIEGSVRNTGIHACGVIITPDDITKFVPVATAKDSDMVCTQFDNSVAEDAGLLKMDFLGLKTLTLIKDACRYVKERHNITLDPDTFPLDDEKTYELFQKGETVGIFQYESAGMQKHMRSLKPTKFEDLIAMNALYRPGPMEYIPSFIARKHGTEEVIYDLPETKEYLEETYGITVYQEQVMLLSQKLAGFSKGEADNLRKAMGKKKRDVLDKMKPDFLKRGEEKGLEVKKLEKIWTDWEAFASYAFNKSHSTCYAWIAYQTAYLKANYPAEYMASVLSNNMNDIKQVTFFMEECRRMGVAVLGPDVNESQYKFAVNENGQIRFGLGAIKGAGRNAIENTVEVRKEEGRFEDCYDYVTKIDLKKANKKTLQSFVVGGAFDSFGLKRSVYFANDGTSDSFLETLIRFGNARKNDANSNQASLFGGESEVAIPQPVAPKVEPWPKLELLKREKEVVGIFISGHPLDTYKDEMDFFTTDGGYEVVANPNAHPNKTVRIAGVVAEALHRTTKTGKPFGILTLEGYDDSAKLYLFGEEYLKAREFLIPELFLHVSGKVGPRKFSKDPNEMEFRIESLALLDAVWEKMGKSLCVEVGLKDITTDLVDKVKRILEEHAGTTKLEFKIRDEKAELPMHSEKQGVKLDAELLKKLKEIEHLACQVESK